ncbi:hypothetical protein HGRIS_003857 [Hohenbuehelia grisea]|uniref:Uncharacterized protein n=1 Tax=Hohenbuehelia grisea TaxID=104357 RepID=A0ABR3JH16_9AGAR
MPTTIPPYVTSARTRSAHSAALSYAFNPCNLEVGYYPAYDYMLKDLFNALSDLRACPRPDIHLSSAELDMRRKADSYTPLEDADVPPSPPPILHGHGEQQLSQGEQSLRISLNQDARKKAKQKARDDASVLAQAEQAYAEMAYNLLHGIEIDAADPDAASEADTSFGSQGTVPDKDSLTIRLDFILRKGLRNIHECFVVFMENKTSPTRHKPNNPAKIKEWRQGRKRHFQEAADDIIFYLSIYFARDSSATAVVAMVASGLHWKWVSFARNKIPVMNFNVPVAELRRRDPVWKNQAVYTAAMEKLDAAEMYTLGTKKSDQALTQLRERTVEIIDHVPYGPTMRRTEGKGKGKGKANEVPGAVAYVEEK